MILFEKKWSLYLLLEFFSAYIMLTDPLSKKHNKWFCFTGWLLTVWLFSTYTFTMVLTEWINYQSERFVIRPVWDHSIRELSSECGMFINMLFIVLFFLFFSVRHLSDLRGHSGFFIPATTASDFEGFLYQIVSITLFSYLNSWERGIISLFNVEC